MALPFVQGHLREEPSSFDIRSECGHCRSRIHIEMTHDLVYRMVTGPADPLVFRPLVDFGKLADASMIDAY